jgi:DNA-binding transcriptional ArsR family regulator
MVMVEGYNSKVALRAYFEANRRVLAEADEMPVSILNTFLGVALWGYDRQKGDPLTIQELSEKVGLPYTTVSRHLRYLGDYYRADRPGLDLVGTEIYAMNRRQKIAFLTTRGRALAEQLGFLLASAKGSNHADLPT